MTPDTFELTDELLHYLWVKDCTNLTAEELWDHYKACLKIHDWNWNQSDDPVVLFIGKREEEQLNILRLACGIYDRERANELYDHFTSDVSW